MPAGNSHNTKGQHGVTRAALFASCPRCGAATLWAAPAMFAAECRACHLDFTAYEPKGRGLYLVVLPVTLLLIAAALRLDDALHPPLWAQALLWPPVIAGAVIGALRFAKAAVLVARFHKDETR